VGDADISHHQDKLRKKELALVEIRS